MVHLKWGSVKNYRTPTRYTMQMVVCWSCLSRLSDTNKSEVTRARIHIVLKLSSALLKTEEATKNKLESTARHKTDSARLTSPLVTRAPYTTTLV